MTTRAPAPRPCESCPYRRDVPSGVWVEEEYDKLLDYDGETWEQPPSAFMCHQQDGRLCAGWVVVHGDDALGLRIALLGMDPAEAQATVEYETDVPLFASGREAHDHGLREVASPGPDAQRVIGKIKRRRG